MRRAANECGRSCQRGLVGHGRRVDPAGADDLHASIMAPGGAPSLAAPSRSPQRFSGGASGPLSGSATTSIRYTATVDMTSLPGADLVAQGLRDIAAGRESEAALLVLIGAPRLRRLGLVVSEPPPEWSATPRDPSPEHRLYALLARSDADSAHSRYNALIRTLVSFERAGECVS